MEKKEINICDDELIQLVPIVATADGKEKWYLNRAEMDAEIGDDKLDFEIRIRTREVKRIEYRDRIYIQDTEFGGFAEKLEISTKTDEITWSGETWRGLLKKKY